MPGCCPDGSFGNPPFPGYSWNEKGVVDEVRLPEVSDCVPSYHGHAGGGHEGVQDRLLQ